MVVKRIGEYSIHKDGTQYYRVKKGRKRIASFLLLAKAENYVKEVLANE